MMETLKDIRKATDNLLKFSSKSNSPQPQSSTNDGRKFSNNPIKLHKLAAASATAAATVIPPSAPACLSSDAVSDTDAEEWMVFETPPEEPKFQRVAVTAARKSSPNRSCESSSSDDFELHSPERVAETVDVDSVQSVGDTNTPPEFPTVFSSLNTVDASESIDSMDNDVAKDEYLLSNPISQSSMSDYSLLEETLVNHEPLLTHAESKENKENTLSHVDIVKTSSSSGFIIPNSLFRISLFLKQEKANILLRLFGTVTLRTINHESICCLNTLLLILLFENKRGQLPQILNKVRELANIEFESVADQPSHEGKDVNEDQDDEGLWCRSCSVPSASTSFFSKRELFRNRTELAERFKADKVNLTGGDLIMRNMRELLWYWQEYYLRRGRDRLSVEFSVHIPFRYWMELIDLLCEDNGAPTSLLDRPIDLPVGPFQRR